MYRFCVIYFIINEQITVNTVKIEIFCFVQFSDTDRENACFEEELTSFKVKKVFKSHQKEKTRIAFSTLLRTM